MSEAASPWWRRLADDFYLQEFVTELDVPHWWKVRTTASVDLVLRTGLGVLITTAMGPILATRAGIARERERLRFYAEYADRANPDEVFVRPPAGVFVREERPGWCGVSTVRVPSRRLSFESPFTPLHPDLTESYARHGRNRRAHALHLVHEDGPRPTIVFLHGFALDAYTVNAWAFSLPWLHAKGWNVLLVTLPFHGARAEWWHPFSGYGSFADGLAHANEAMLQSVSDVRVWIDYLFAHGAPTVGVSGLSLGGYLTAVLASVDERLAFAIPNSPVVLPIDMAMEWQPTGGLLRLAMAREDVTLAELRHATALHGPLTYPPKLTGDRLMVIGGAGDRFTSPRFVHLLHKHWAGSHLHWFPGNHVLHLDQRSYLKSMRAVMDRAVAT